MKTIFEKKGQPKEEVSFEKGRLVVNNIGGSVVLCTDAGSWDIFSGVVIHSDGTGNQVGRYSDYWYKNSFSQVEDAEITLKV